MASTIQLMGRVFITFDIQALTGLHIGGSDTGIEIGGVDKTIIRDPLTNKPYIPGSSLKGKMRSLLEKYNGLPQNQRIGQGYIHSCQIAEEYVDCAVCLVFGVPGERKFATPTRLVVRDVHMSADSARELTAITTDLPYSEVKTEVSIDRVTSAANPRQMERVPAGAVFGGKTAEGQPQPAELVYTIYSGERCDPLKDVQNLKTIVEGLQLLEDDYLGGLGSRGSGKVKITNIQVALRDREDYTARPETIGQFDDLEGLVTQTETLQTQIRQKLALEG